MTTGLYSRVRQIFLNYSIFLSSACKAEPREEAVVYCGRYFTMEFLMGILESRAVEYGKDFNESKHRADPEILKCMDINLLDYKFLLIYLKNGWDKLDNYYNFTDNSSVYIVSLFLH
jgi:hypothetical protein